MSRHVRAGAWMICLKGIFTLLHCMYTHTHAKALNSAINHPPTLPKPDLN